MGDAIERRREPFVPDPNRMVYPVDHVTSQRAALAKFEAETRIEVGGQLTRRIVHRAGQLEDEIRERARDGAHYSLMEQVLVSFLADAIEVRHTYMRSDDEPGPWR
jgi:hypothetical protein